ncbi:MAG: hypothetical protein EOR67_13185 [Mesorhizobium sp.]|nr:MAG: hypothetical protein EOR69_19435 [Mesorhizobium sp.]RWL88265.1 MAG: hypothetical protein EOR67_13185 [Mesorhizobium sp.]RWL96957.1 MAG: hypothetical protein EOR70_17385 [Mesorhizobium sp.]
MIILFRMLIPPTFFFVVWRTAPTSVRCASCHAFMSLPNAVAYEPGNILTP